MASCRRLFSLTWYDDITYASNKINGITTKLLPTICYNGSGCQSIKPEFLEREQLFEVTSSKYSESEREWIVFRTLGLQKWREETSKRLWRKEGIEHDMPVSIIMSDICLMAIAKNANILIIVDSMLQFLEPWSGVKKHHIEFLACLSTATNIQDPASFSQQSDQKAALVAAKASKKVKYMDNPVIAKAAKMTAL